MCKGLKSKFTLELDANHVYSNSVAKHFTGSQLDLKKMANWHERIHRGSLPTVDLNQPQYPQVLRWITENNMNNGVRGNDISVWTGVLWQSSSKVGLYPNQWRNCKALIYWTFNFGDKLKRSQNKLERGNTDNPTLTLQKQKKEKNIL